MSTTNPLLALLNSQPAPPLPLNMPGPPPEAPQPISMPAQAPVSSPAPTPAVATPSPMPAITAPKQPLNIAPTEALGGQPKPQPIEQQNSASSDQFVPTKAVPPTPHAIWQTQMNNLQGRIDTTNPTDPAYPALLQAHRMLQYQQPRGFWPRFGIDLLQNVGAQFAPQAARAEEAREAEQNRMIQSGIQESTAAPLRQAQTKEAEARAATALNRPAWKMNEGENGIVRDANGEVQGFLGVNTSTGNPQYIPNPPAPAPTTTGTPQASGGGQIPPPQIPQQQTSPLLPPGSQVGRALAKPTEDEIRAQYLDAVHDQMSGNKLTAAQQKTIDDHRGAFAGITPVGSDPAMATAFGKQIKNIQDGIPQATRGDFAPPTYNPYDTPAEMEKKLADARSDAKDITSTFRSNQKQGESNTTKNDVRNDKSFQYNNTVLDKLENPVEQSMQRFSRLSDTLNQHSPQADALIAPELLSVMAGGVGSGVRMNEAEISRIVGGRSNWENLQAAVQKWNLDASSARSITHEQDKEIRNLIEAVGSKLTQKRNILDAARDDLLNTDDPKEHRQIVNDARKKLNDIDTVKAGNEPIPRPAGAPPGAIGISNGNYVDKNYNSLGPVNK